MWIKRFLMLAISSGLAAKAVQIVLEKGRQQRLHRERVQQREAVQRWEDEGGNPQPR